MNDAERLEERIAALERETEEHEALLCREEVYRDGARVREIQSANAKAKQEMEALYARWDELS